MAARERGRPPRQVGPPVLLRARLREPPAVIDAVTAREMACKTQAARRARAEALASRAGAMLPHDFLELDASRSASHPSAVRPMFSTQSKRTRPPARRFEFRSRARLAHALRS